MFPFQVIKASEAEVLGRVILSERRMRHFENLTATMEVMIWLQ